jgi:hypothetical protein
MKMTWLSFANERKALGVCILDGWLTEEQARTRAIELGIHPEADHYDVTRLEEEDPMHDVYVANRDRFVPGSEIEALFDAVIVKVATTPKPPHAN